MYTSASFRFFIFIFLPVLGSLMGCGKKHLKKTVIPVENQISRYSDIPLPLGYTVTESSQQDGIDYVVCKGNMSSEQLTNFYKQSMEAQGWNIKSLMTKDEGLLLCSKPFRLCTISLRPNRLKNNNFKKNIASVYMFVHHRETRDKTSNALNDSIINGKTIV